MESLNDFLTDSIYIPSPKAIWSHTAPTAVAGGIRVAGGCVGLGGVGFGREHTGRRQWTWRELVIIDGGPLGWIVVYCNSYYAIYGVI